MIKSDQKDINRTCIDTIQKEGIYRDLDFSESEEETSKKQIELKQQSLVNSLLEIRNTKTIQNIMWTRGNEQQNEVYVNHT